MIAQDAQGAEVARPWVEKAGGTFRSLLDQENVVGKRYGLKYVPVGILMDESGRLVKAVSSVNIGDEAFRAELTQWVAEDRVPEVWQENGQALREMTPSEAEADARFQLAVVLLKSEKKEQAIQELQAAMLLDPENWLIRKQLWAIETPEAFYKGDVDYTWQAEQKDRETNLIESRGSSR